MPAPAVSIEELSRLIDGQLADDEKASVEKRLQSCAVSRRLLEGMRELHAELAAAFLENPSLENEPRTAVCLDDDTLMLLAEGKLAPEQAQLAEAHAAGCPRCLRALLVEMRSHVSMKSGHWKELPPEVITHPRLGNMPKPKSGVGRDGKPADGKAETLFSSGKNKGASAPTEKAAPAEPEIAITGELRYELSSRTEMKRPFAKGDYALSVLLRAGDSSSANLEILVTRQGKPLWEAEVTVAEPKTERKIFRGLSNRDGRVMVRKMKAGAYEIQVPAADLRVTLAIVA